MIIEKLVLTEFETERNIRKESEKLEAVQSILGLLNQIDFNAEVVPVEDHKRLTKLLVSLKGEALTENEMMVANDLAN